MWGAIIGSVITAIMAMVQANQQETSNEHIAQFQADANQAYQDRQNEYNTPANQMKRFADAGLNPHLVYGSGSPGNQQSPLTFPDIKSVDRQRITVDPNTINQGRLVDAQVQAQNASTRQKHAVTAVNILQADVLRKNPLLDDGGFKAIIDGLKAAAELKVEQTQGQRISNFVDARTTNERIDKVWAEVQLLTQRFKLGEQDQAIKAEVLKSKEFQNAILEVQKKFMTDADITPQHILQFVQLLLMKIL